METCVKGNNTEEVILVNGVKEKVEEGKCFPITTNELRAKIICPETPKRWHSEADVTLLPGIIHNISCETGALRNEFRLQWFPPRVIVTSKVESVATHNSFQNEKLN